MNFASWRIPKKDEKSWNINSYSYNSSKKETPNQNLVQWTQIILEFNQHKLFHVKCSKLHKDAN